MAVLTSKKVRKTIARSQQVLVFRRSIQVLCQSLVELRKSPFHSNCIILAFSDTNHHMITLCQRTQLNILHSGEDWTAVLYYEQSISLIHCMITFTLQCDLKLHSFCVTNLDSMLLVSIILMFKSEIRMLPSAVRFIKPLLKNKKNDVYKFSALINPMHDLLW